MHNPIHRKLFSLVALVLLACTLLSFPAVATGAEPATPEDPVDPAAPYVDIDSFYASISINSSGKASCYSYAKTATFTYKISLTMTLQRYVGGQWTKVTSWSTSGTGSASLSKSYYVSSGYYYRTMASAYVTTSGGSSVESPTIYSASQYY